jgi:hypothetical protein
MSAAISLLIIVLIFKRAKKETGHDYRGLYDFHRRLPAAERKRLMVLRIPVGTAQIGTSLSTRPLRTPLRGLALGRAAHSAEQLNLNPAPV